MYVCVCVCMYVRPDMIFAIDWALSTKGNIILKKMYVCMYVCIDLPQVKL